MQQSEMTMNSQVVYAYLDANGIVVNIIVGDLTEEDERAIFSDEQSNRGAVSFIRTTRNARPMIGGAYTDGVFQAPPAPEPEPLPEPIVEPEV